MKKTKSLFGRLFSLILCLMMFFDFNVMAQSSEEEIISLYRLSDKAVEFMREHNVDFSLFEGAEVYPEDHPTNYSRSIESLIMQSQAYGFTDEQISDYIKGLINTKPTIIGGPYDNTGRKKIIVPEYPFVINGVSIDYKDSQYPVISYNDITYFPMTWHYCRMLGVTTDWSMEKGLYITKEQSHAEPLEYNKADNKSERNLYAVVPEYDIFVNEKKIDNNSEEYPVLNFRNVTYFPLTWDCITNELGWTYIFDTEKGIKIELQ